jgi:parallel beta-helix repeat protein
MRSVRTKGLISRFNLNSRANDKQVERRDRSTMLARASVSVIEGLEARTLFSTIQVTNGMDNSSGTPIAGSLRAAIVAANTTPGSTISFSMLPVNTVITLAASLATTPITGQGTNIDGTTSAAGRVTIDGAGFDGLDVTGNDVDVQGLWLKNMGTALLLDGGQNDSVTDNYIGDVTNSGMDTNTDGIMVTDGASDDTIGGPLAIDRNVISGNSTSASDGAGITLSDPTGLGTGNNFIEGNYIGVTPDGTAAAPNDFGIVISDSNGNTIQSNVISGNTNDGIEAVNYSTAYYMYAETITSNIIGLDAASQNPVPNGSGIFMDGGLASFGDTISLNTIEFNAGIGIEDNQVQDTITNNTIVSNGGTGVQIDSTGVLDTISQNSIYLNGAGGPAYNLGIDLGGDGVTQNTATSGTTSTGANGLQSFPVIGTIVPDSSDSTMLTVPFSLQANPSTRYTIEVFASSPSNVSPSGYGQGQSYITSTTITTDTTGAASGSVNISNAIYQGFDISATATNADTYNMTTNPDGGSTSEFSLDQVAPGTAAPTLSIKGGSAVVGRASVSRSCCPRPAVRPPRSLTHTPRGRLRFRMSPPSTGCLPSPREPRRQPSMFQSSPTAPAPPKASRSRCRV